MTFEEHMRIIELKELNSEDQRKVFTKLVCVYYENKSDDEHLSNFCEPNSFNSQENNVKYQIKNDFCSDKDNEFKKSFSASDLNSSLFSFQSGNKVKDIFPKSSIFIQVNITIQFVSNIIILVQSCEL